MPLSDLLLGARMFAVTSDNELATRPSETGLVGSRRPEGRVLFVDDDAICRRAFSELGARHGLSIDLAASCDEAIGFARKHQYDLIVCDLMLPRLDGREVVERLRHTQERARYVFTTGSEPGQVVETFRTIPHSGMLWKPWQAHEVVELFERLLPPDAMPTLSEPAPLSGTILVVEAEAQDPSRLSKSLPNVLAPEARLLRRASLEQALLCIASEHLTIVLLDLSVPDARGVEAIERLSVAALAAPVLVVSDADDETLAIQAVQLGAQDYLLETEMDDRSLLRAMHHVVDRSRSQRTLARVALYDQLTGAASRMLFEVRAEQVMSAAKHTGSPFALLFVDLDHFKNINDQYGHDVGDALLAAFALRLSDCLRAGQLLARLGGDEFVILAEHCGRGQAKELGSKIAAALIPPFDLAGQSHRLSASVGMSVFPEDGTSIKQLLRHADLAMYRVKGHRRRPERPVFPEAHARAESELVAALGPALERREFEVHYQPIVDLATRRPFGIEAFVRWRHEREGLLHPAAFLHALGEAGMVQSMGHFVLSQSCLLLSRVHSLTGRDLRLFVNVSAAQLCDRGFASLVCDALNQHGLRHGDLELDLTEEVLHTEQQGARQSLRLLRDQGVRVCLDDFGAGASSLTQLRRANIDSIKIDRSVVARLGKDEGIEGVVRATVAMARALRLVVMAEGVETDAQDRLLRLAGCDFGQGLLYGPPMPADELLRFASLEC